MPISKVTKKDADLEVIDSIGQVDEMEDLEEIELSSDDEDDEDDIALIVLKRPPVTERTIEEVEITDDIEVTGGGGGVNLVEKKGFVKEFIETEGLAMILSKDYGLVLFHLDSVWIGNQNFGSNRTRDKLVLGTEVHFYDKTYRGNDYKDLSEDKVIHQAVAVWTGEKRPDSVLKKITDDAYKKKLEEYRRTFLLYLRGEVFLRAAWVRAKGEVAGYLNEFMGIIEITEGTTKHNVLFSVEDCAVYKKEVQSYGGSAKRILPVGCAVSVDARKVHIVGLKNVEYQAIVVIAGPWPAVPFPTLLPGGQGSKAPAYDMPKGMFTFYYMELALEGRLTRKLNAFKDLMRKTRGQINFDWNNVAYIQNKEDFKLWKSQFEGSQPRKRTNNMRGEKREVLDTFKATEADEIENKDTKTKVTQKTVQERTWYTPEAWEHGGLRIKDEVKDEMENEFGGGSAAKKVKKEGTAS